jgi:hypothetical protein
MAQIINATTHADSRGKLTVIDKLIPFDIKRIFYIYDVSADRGKHCHKRNISALLCVKGTCRVKVNDGKSTEVYALDAPEKILVLQPEEYRTMFDFSPDAVLLVLASEHFDPDDYIDEPLS